MSDDRRWMYAWRIDGCVALSYREGLKKFLDFACAQPNWMDGPRIRCPCRLKKCQNRAFREREDVELHLLQNGFIPDYYTWRYHGETEVSSSQSHHNVEEPPLRSNFETMVMDAAGPSFNQDFQEEETPNLVAQKFYDMLGAANKPLYPGCEDLSQLSYVAQMLNLKAENHLSERGFDGFAKLFRRGLPKDNLAPGSFYETKRFVQALGLPVERIDCCPKGCMIYWGKDEHLTTCKICSQSRYKKASEGSQRRKVDAPNKEMYYFPLTPRLLRLYASNATATDMRWHAEHATKEGVMQHPSDSIAWKHFNHTFPDFAAEVRNIRLGLCTDGFQAFGQFGQPYSCWPVIVTVYNLPPWMCMKDNAMFLTALVPGPKNPKDNIDVYLQPLITELISLWENGVQAYDTSTKQNFVLRAALMWTISDFPAYGMLSGWTTSGLLACPYCMHESDAFHLSHSKKCSWFDNSRKFLEEDHSLRRNKDWFLRNKKVSKSAPEVMSGHDVLEFFDEIGLKRVTEEGATKYNKPLKKLYGWRKRSIFWDLPYWSSNLIRHNLDVMHIEKNVFDNVWHTILDTPGKTKDTLKSRQELNEYCKRAELSKKLANGKYPKASYTLDKQKKEVLFDWIKTLKFPDGYVSNLGRCLTTNGMSMSGMKSHDCHVFMQRLLPIAFRELLPSNVWKALTELSNFFKQLTSTVIANEDMAKLEAEIPIILCKLERIFPPSFFDSMEHLPLHLPYEARIAGPVQFRWMYAFERYLRKLKLLIGNKAHVESSICNAYLIEETSAFVSYYFDDHVQTRLMNVSRNYEGNVESEGPEYEGRLSIFRPPGRSLGKGKKGPFEERESKAAQSYILLNCEEVEPYVVSYSSFLQDCNPDMEYREVYKKLETDFPDWLKSQVLNPNNNIENIFMVSLARGPQPVVKRYTGYYVNGYRFHTVKHGSSKGSMNSGVCIKGTAVNESSNDFYGLLVEVVEIEYWGYPEKKIVLFKCEWFDPMPSGTRVHKEYNIIEINHKKRYSKYEPFVLASQATQVYYCSYPSVRRDKVDWWVVSKIKARGVVDTPEQSVHYTAASDPPPFQEESIGVLAIDLVNDDNDAAVPLVDPSGLFRDHVVGEENEDELEREDYEEEPEFQTESDTESEEDLDAYELNDSDSD